MGNRLLASMMAGLIVLGTTACGSTNESSGTGEPEKGQTTPTASAVVIEDADPFKKYDPPITISTIRSIDETSDSMKLVDGEDAENNVMYKLFEDLMGIKVTNKILAAPNASKDKMQLAIASDDIPDFGLVDQTTLAQLIKGDMVEDLTPYYEAYASENLKTVLGQSENALFEPAQRDGKTYALPAPTTIYDYTPVLWINKTWRENLGYQLPKSMDEVFDLAMAFATQDPDKNGEKDTYGLYMNKELEGVNFIMNAYGVYSTPFTGDATRYMMWFKNSEGNYENGVTDPKTVDVLKRFNELYKAGGIDPEFAIKDVNKANELIAAGKVGMYTGYFYSAFTAYDMRKNFPDAQWETISFPAAQGVDEYRPGVPLNAYGYYYVKKGYTNPEALVVMMNYVCDGYGAPWLVEGEPTEFDKRYTEAANDPKYSGKNMNNWMPLQIAGNINWGPIFQEAIDKGETQVKGKQADFDRVTKTEEPLDKWLWEMIYLNGYMSAEYANVKYSDYNGAPTTTWQQVKSLLDKEQLEAYVGFIMGEKSLDEFDDFVSRYNSLGASKIAEEIKEAKAQ